MTFYLQLQDKDGAKCVTDVVEMSHGNYVPVDLDLPLPIGAYSGEYELLNGKLVHRKDWIVPTPNSIESEIEDLKEADIENKLALVEIYELMLG